MLSGRGHALLALCLRALARTLPLRYPAGGLPLPLPPRTCLRLTVLPPFFLLCWSGMVHPIRAERFCFGLHVLRMLENSPGRWFRSSSPSRFAGVAVNGREHAVQRVRPGQRRYRRRRASHLPSAAGQCLPPCYSSVRIATGGVMPGSQYPHTSRHTRVGVCARPHCRATLPCRAVLMRYSAIPLPIWADGGVATKSWDAYHLCAHVSFCRLSLRAVGKLLRILRMHYSSCLQCRRGANAGVIIPRCSVRMRAGAAMTVLPAILTSKRGRHVFGAGCTPSLPLRGGGRCTGAEHAFWLPHWVHTSVCFCTARTARRLLVLQDRSPPRYFAAGGRYLLQLPRSFAARPRAAGACARTPAALLYRLLVTLLR